MAVQHLIYYIHIKLFCEPFAAVQLKYYSESCFCPPDGYTVGYAHCKVVRRKKLNNEPKDVQQLWRADGNCRVG